MGVCHLTGFACCHSDWYRVRKSPLSLNQGQYNFFYFFLNQALEQNPTPSSLLIITEDCKVLSICQDQQQSSKDSATPSTPPPTKGGRGGPEYPNSDLYEN